MDNAPFPDTPEDTESRQGRRNATVHLLDEDGIPKRAHVHILKDILGLDKAYITDEGLDRFAKDTNGLPLPIEAKEELRDSLDVTQDGHLTFQGFLQLYHLQTESDEEETWHDLTAHGFDRDLNLVSSRSHAVDEEKVRVPMDRLRGLGMGGEEL
ncbi:uncharacterized protein EI90DRAFT_3114585 [Cantharellus anzutake]|uniref:uncharacterized protein n=1 Tax=Cantharellus anzutake TaxID=1750568 RepID=UPI0019074295|nr:uncharacterized protein EI90DRAFT_3114585 [Cantharellus anzutake]KAF8343938.1 hypothetical protein EI90DRAFT_3114585 [Cantharellus anzutake]